MPPTLTYDQGALPAGTVGESRDDLVIGSVVTVTIDGVAGADAAVGMLSRPGGSATVLVGSPPSLTRTFTPDAAGSYEVRAVDTTDGSKTRHTCTVLTARRKVHIPASNEVADPRANDVDADPGSQVEASSTNKGANPQGWHPGVEKNWRILEGIPDAMILQFGTGNVSGSGTVPRYPLPGNENAQVGTAELYAIAPYDCTIDQLISEWGGTPNAIDVAITLRKEFVNTALTVTVEADVLAADNLTDEVDYLKGERISLAIVKSAGLGSQMAGFQASVRIRAKGE